jgi:hypothetical protein
MSNNNIEQKLQSLRNLNSDQPEMQKITIHKLSKTSWVNWTDIKRAYILGKRSEEFDEETGHTRIWSESYNLEELAREFGVGVSQLTKKSAIEGWGGLRDSYLARVQEEALGTELGYFTTEESETEANSLAIIRKGMKLINLGLEQEYGDLLEAVDADGDVDLREYSKVNLKALTEGIKGLKMLHEMHGKVMEQAPKTNQELLDQLNRSKTVERLKNPKEREKLQKELQKKLQLLSQIEEDDDED